MAARGIGADQAFEELSQQSQSTSTKLREVAARMVERGRRGTL